MSTDTVQRMRSAVAEVLAEDPETITDQENLFEAGLDSMGLLRLVNRWRRDGLEVNFADLAQNPTLAAWTALIDHGGAHAGNMTQTNDNNATNSQGLGDEAAPLGIMQHAYWVGRGVGQRLGGVAAHLYAEFDQAATGGNPAINPDTLRTALQHLIERHETLRTRITSDGKQAVLPAVAPPLAVHDLRDKSETDVEKRLGEIRDAFSHQMLDIENGEVFATALSLLPDGATRLHVDVDMVAADAVSYRILLTDLIAFYTAPGKAPPPLALTYRDYLMTVEEGKEERARQASEVWQDRLGGLPGAPVLPETIVAAEDYPTPRVARHHVWLSPERKQALSKVARRNGVTVAMTMATILAEVVGHWSRTERFLLNVPMFDRRVSHPDIDRVVGDFSSSVMLEVDLRQPLSFVDRVRALQQRMHQDAAHAAYTGLDVLRDLSRRQGETVLAPVVFTSALGLGELFAPDVTDIIGRPVWIISQGPQVLLDSQVTEFEGGLLVNWDTREEALAPGVVEAMFSLFEGALQRVIDEPGTWDRPLKLSQQVPPERRFEGQSVRVVDHLGRDRPDHVAGRLLSADETPSEAALWARADGDGRVKILGEDRERVEVNGVLVLPIEIEEAVRSDRRVEDVAVLRTEDSLVATVVFQTSANGEPVPSGKAFRTHLARRIPAHLLPPRIVVLDELPRDSLGQTDTDAIRQLAAAQAGPAEDLAPRSDLEQVIADVWAEVLGLERVGANEEFIALGGDSLLAARVVARLQEELDTAAVTLRALFRSPTVAELAEQLRKDDDAKRLDEVAAIVLEIRGMSNEEVAALLEAGSTTTAAEKAEAKGGLA